MSSVADEALFAAATEAPEADEVWSAETALALLRLEALRPLVAAKYCLKVL